jgi:hypothetical protein
MENPEQATEILEWLRGAGAEIALDDFGMGYSSFAYLERLPFDSIKIDQAIMQSSSAKGGSSLVRSIVALAHELGKKVVAKGVENGEEIAFLRSIGCEYAQGGYCGDPIPDAEVVQVLKMLRRSESKLQPRGLFRTKPKKKREPKQGTNGERGEAQVAARANGSHPLKRPAGTGAPQIAEPREPRSVRSLPNSAVRVRPRGQPQPQQQMRTQGVGGPAPALSRLPPHPAALAPVPPLPSNPLVGAGGLPPPPAAMAPPAHHLRPVEQMPAQPPMPPPLPAAPPPMTGGATRPPWPQEAAVPPRPPMPPPVAMPMPPAASAPAPQPPSQQRAPITVPSPAAPPPPDFSSLPPAIAESLSRLAGSIKPPPKSSGV